MLRHIFIILVIVFSASYLHSQEWKKYDALFEKEYSAANWQTAERHGIDCLKAAEKECAKADSGYEKSLHNLAIVYEAMDSLQLALNYWSELFKIQTTRMEKIDPNFGMVVTSYSDMYRSIREPKLALTTYKKVVERLKKVKAVDNSIYYELSTIYSNECVAFYSTAPAKSDETKLAETKQQYGETSDEYLHMLDSLGVASKTMAQFAKAKSFFIEGRKVRNSSGKNKSEEYARTCTNLAYIYFIGQKPDSSIFYYSEGIEAWKKYGKTNNSDYAEALLYHVMSYQFKQDWAKCCELYEEALPVVKSVFGEEHYWYSAVLVSLGSFNKILNNNDKAEKYYLEDMRIKKQRKDTVEMNYFSDYWGLANIYDVKGESEKASFYFRKVNDLTLKNIKLMVNSMNITSEKKIAQSIVGFQFSLDWIYSFMVRSTGLFPDLTTYIYNNELVKKGLVMRVMKSKMETALNSKDTSLINALDRWLLLRQQISKLNLLPVSERVSNLAQMETEARRIEDDMYYKLYELQKDKDLSNDWKEVRDALKPGEAAIEYFNFDYFDYTKGKFPDSTLYYALILRPEYQYPKIVPLFCGQSFQSFLIRNKGKNPLDQVRRLYSWASGAYMDKNRGDSLYGFIWKPIEKELNGVKKVYYSPSGLLHKISFSAIPLNDSISMVDKYQLQQMTSTAMIINKKEDFILSEEYKALLYGGILYDMDTSEIERYAGKYKVHGDFFIRDRSFEITDSIRGGGTWPYLNGTLLEINLIDSLFLGSKLNTRSLTKADAVEESFRYSEELHPEIIHIATHGFFLPEPPPPPRDPLNPYSVTFNSQTNTDDAMLRSGLLFAGANSTWQGKKPGIGLDDGILTAYEVSRLNLSRTRLVVLSACETGLGEVKGSEGVYGLQRAFKLAGVDYIIMSLWQIPDEQTVELMRYFYSAWLKGMDIKDAFHYAQKEMNKEYEPYFWAAFVLLE